MMMMMMMMMNVYMTRKRSGAMLYLSHGEDCIDEQQDDDNRDEQCEVIHRASQH